MTSIAKQRDAAFEHRHRPDLDGIRGLLALLVMLLHYRINSLTAQAIGQPWPGFAFGFCVDVFFLLSGFVLSSSYLASADRSFTRFAVKRFFRLAPVFYVTTLLVLPVATTNYRWDLLAAETVMGVPFFAQMPANYPAWSITWEFYWPLAAFLAARWVTIPRQLLLPLLLACLGAMVVADIQLAAGERFYAVRAPLALGAGVLLYRLYAEAPPARTSHHLTYTLFAALFAVMATAKSLPLLAALVPPLAAALVWSAAGAPSPLFSSRLLQWLGALSYTLYMAHVPVLQAMKAALGEGVVRSPLAMLAGIGLSFLLAVALTKLVEVPGIRLGHAVLGALRPRRTTEA